METNNLFDLRIDNESTGFLSEAARWAKFLAIIGFVMCALMFIGGLFASLFMSSLTEGMEGLGGESYATYSSYNRKFTMVFYVVFGIISVFPYLYLFRFATRMQEALRSSDQDVLNSSFSNLKSLFKFVGILTIIMLGFLLLALVFAIIAFSAAM